MNTYARTAVAVWRRAKARTDATSNLLGMDAAMRSYYEQRAREYDDWWLGTGLFADRVRPGWDEDVAALKEALSGLAPARTLDVACGTGFLTEALPGELTGIDQSETMVAVASARLPDAEFAVGDAFAPPYGDGAFERVHTAHFYGHLDDRQRAAFLAEAARLARELVVVDSALRPDGEPEAWQERKLNDGSRHSVYKRWFTAEGLAQELGGGVTVYAGPWFVAVRTTRPSPRS
jgi:SAM-dependent methyltransferase